MQTNFHFKWVCFCEMKLMHEHTMLRTPIHTHTRTILIYISFRWHRLNSRTVKSTNTPVALTTSNRNATTAVTTTTTATIPASRIKPPASSKLKAPKHRESLEASGNIVRQESTTKVPTTSGGQPPTVAATQLTKTAPPAVKSKNASKDGNVSTKLVKIKPLAKLTKVPAQAHTQVATIDVAAAESSQSAAVTKKPSLLPKPKVKVVIPPAILQHQQQMQQEQDAETEVTSPTSRIPVRAANAEKRALLAGTARASSSLDFSASSPMASSFMDGKKSKSLIK